MIAPSRIIAAVLAVAMLALATAPLLASADGNANLRLYVKGRDVTGIQITDTYEIVVIGADSGTWTYKYYLTGDNLTDANPLVGTPSQGNISETSFLATVTMPNAVGTVELVVNITQSSAASPTWQTVTKKIEVVRPVALLCQVRNPTTTDLSAIPYKVYVDGEETDNSTLELLSAGSTVNVSSAWYAKDPREGAHEAIYTFDVDGDGMFGSNDDLTVSYTFYTKDDGTNWALALTVALGIIVFVVGFLLVRRKNFR